MNTFYQNVYFTQRNNMEDYDLTNDEERQLASDGMKLVHLPEIEKKVIKVMLLLSECMQRNNVHPALSEMAVLNMLNALFHAQDNSPVVVRKRFMGFADEYEKAAKQRKTNKE